MAPRGLSERGSFRVDAFLDGEPFAVMVKKGQAPERATAQALKRRLGADVTLWPVDSTPSGMMYRAQWYDSESQTYREAKVEIWHAFRSRTRQQPQERLTMPTRRDHRLAAPRTSGEPLAVTIPTMDWEQVDGDMDPGAHGGTIARGDGDLLELIQIQPVREYVGDLARDVGFPFWTREASYDAADLDPSKPEVQSAMRTLGIDEEMLREMEKPTSRALALASALLAHGYGVEEGPSGWSADIGIPDRVKWWDGKVAGAEYLADEDDAFRDDVLGYADIRTAIEETVQRMADQRSAEAWSTLGDQVVDDLARDGFDAESAVGVATFGDATGTNGDVSEDVSLANTEDDLQHDGYELTGFGGDIPHDETEVSAEHVVRAVMKELKRSKEDVEAAAKGLDWWAPNIAWSTQGYSAVWAKRAGATATNELSERGTMVAMKRRPVTVTLRTESGEVLHTETKAAMNSGIRASEAAVREIARAEHTHYSGDRPKSAKSDGFHVDSYERRWVSQDGRVIVATVEQAPYVAESRMSERRHSGRVATGDFRIAYLGAGARRTHLEGAFSRDEAVKQLNRLKRLGRTAWIEDGAGNFVPVPGATRRPQSNELSERRRGFSTPAPSSRHRTIRRRRR